MQKYKTHKAMMYKCRLRAEYYYHKPFSDRAVFDYKPRQYYQFEKEATVRGHRTCQSAFYTYNCGVPIWFNRKTFWE